LSGKGIIVLHQSLTLGGNFVKSRLAMVAAVVGFYLVFLPVNKQGFYFFQKTGVMDNISDIG
jgi:hypothetical protein